MKSFRLPLVRQFFLSLSVVASFLAAGVAQAQVPFEVVISGFTEVVGLSETTDCPVLQGTLSGGTLTLKLNNVVVQTTNLGDNFTVDCILPTALGASLPKGAAGGTFVFSSPNGVLIGPFLIKYQGTLKVVDASGYSVLQGGFTVRSADGTGRINGGGSLTGSETINPLTSVGYDGKITLTGVVTGLN